MRLFILFIFVIISGWATTAYGQTQEHKSFDISSIYQTFEEPPSPTDPQLAAPWWNRHVAQSQRREVPEISIDIHTLMYLATVHSNQVRIAAEDPVIRETAIEEADANFDWVRYFNGGWTDTSDPVSNSLTLGNGADRFKDHVLQGAGGVRRANRYGGQFDISQRFGWQDNNSDFFVPADQATSRLTLSYSHPLLRGRGYAYNTSLVVLAELDAQVAQDEFTATLQSHLLEVARSYWALYLERAALAQQVRLYLKTKDVVKALRSRQKIDAQRTQLVLAAAALESRRADLIRSRTAVVNAETRLRGLINAPELNNSDQAELVPKEFPSLEYYPIELRSKLETAIANRPEAMAATKQIQAGAKRLGIARNELMPVLNLVAQTYVSGLQGQSDFAESFADQFSRGAPSYYLGVQYEMPFGNRAAKARYTRRHVELRQLQTQYQQALTAIQTEVDIAVREFKTAYREIRAKSRALAAAEAEAKTIELRWRGRIDGGGNSGLNLESLLRAQERVTSAEREYVTSLLTYNLSSVNLKKATGTLLQSENVAIGKVCDPTDGPSLIINKDGGESSQYSPQESSNVEHTMPLANERLDPPDVVSQDLHRERRIRRAPTPLATDEFYEGRRPAPPLTMPYPNF